MLKTEGMLKKKFCIYETYKNIVIPNGHHSYSKASDMEKATMCEYTQSGYALTHCKFVLRCYEKCSSINLPD